MLVACVGTGDGAVMCCGGDVVWYVVWCVGDAGVVCTSAACGAARVVSVVW